MDTSHFILHCPATDSLRRSLWRLSVSLRPLVQALQSFPVSGAPWSSAMLPSLGRGRVTTRSKNALKRMTSKISSRAVQDRMESFMNRAKTLGCPLFPFCYPLVYILLSLSLYDFREQISTEVRCKNFFIKFGHLYALGAHEKIFGGENH